MPDGKDPVTRLLGNAVIWKIWFILWIGGFIVAAIYFGVVPAFSAFWVPPLVIFLLSEAYESAPK